MQVFIKNSLIYRTNTGCCKIPKFAYFDYFVALVLVLPKWAYLFLNSKQLSGSGLAQNFIPGVIVR